MMIGRDGLVVGRVCKVTGEDDAVGDTDDAAAIVSFFFCDNGFCVGVGDGVTLGNNTQSVIVVSSAGSSRKIDM